MPRLLDCHGKSPQNWSGRFEEEKDLLTLLGIKSYNFIFGQSHKSTHTVAFVLSETCYLLHIFTANQLTLSVHRIFSEMLQF